MAEETWTAPDPITAGATRVRKKTIHFTELQDAINAWETAYSIANTNFADSPATLVRIKLTAITEMQDALDALLTLANADTFSWTVPIITSSVLPAHINELRDNMNTMQDTWCYQCDMPDGGSCTLCDSECYSDACDLCDATCNVESCTCDSTCNVNACSTCDTSCNGYSACTNGCNNVCYVDTKYLCTCDTGCYGYSACSCHSTCYNDACDQCDATCYEESCTCNSTCYSNACDTCDSTCNTFTCTKCNAAVYRYPWT